ncbi:C4-dicarboxylate transporter DctA, partial [Mesorhizobium sp. M1A.F.Ca.IN.022.07.1.1]
GVDRFMSECRALTNFVGNDIETSVGARWEGELDQKQFAAAMAGQMPEEADLALSGGLQPA